MKPIVILRAGDPAPPIVEARGRFSDWISKAIADEWSGEFSVVDVREDVPLPSPDDATAFIMTGSSSSVTERAPWMLRAEEHLRAIVKADVPFFGICFGHQMLAQALGGEVTRNPKGREIGSIRVKRTPGDEAIFDGVPNVFSVNATHVDTVARLPKGARVLAASQLDPTQAFMIGRANVCVQFHPEFDADVMRRYVRARAHLIESEGQDPRAIEARVADAPDAARILTNWVERFVTA